MKPSDPELPGGISFRRVYIAGLALLNLTLIASAWRNHGEGAIVIVLLVPVINGLLALFALLSLYEASRLPGYSAREYWLTYIDLPVAAVGAFWLSLRLLP